MSDNLTLKQRQEAAQQVDEKALDFLAWVVTNPVMLDSELEEWQINDLGDAVGWLSKRLGIPDRREFWRGKFDEAEKMSRRFDMFHPEPYWTNHPFKDELADWANIESDYHHHYKGWEWWEDWLLANPVSTWTTEEIEAQSWPPESDSLFNEAGSYFPERY